MSPDRITHPLRPIWSPADTERLREDAAQYPVEIGQSPMLHLILGCEGITL